MTVHNIGAATFKKNEAAAPTHLVTAAPALVQLDAYPSAVPMRTFICYWL